MSPFEIIEMCRDMVPLLGTDAAAVELAAASGGYVGVDAALELLGQHAPMSGRVVVADPPT